MGYHLTEIINGKYGEVSKIQEELDELKDAIEQGNKIMALVELSDILGAIQGYLENYFPDITLEDLHKMTNATNRAFQDGTRQPKG
jgi:hypothetical protein